MSVNKVDKTTGNTSLLAGSTLWADSPIGSILPYGGASAPSGWFLCQGQAVSRTTYSELFAVIGTSFGAGDGSTTFNLPDMRESVPKGAGETGKTVGAHVKSGGLAVGEFLDDRVQTHTHSENGTVSGGSVLASGSGKEISGRNTGNNSGRTGATTEVKSVGVNYIIKAKMVAVPSDFMSKVDEAVEEAITDVIKIQQIDLGKVTIAANGNYSINLTNYGIDTHGRPWLAFVYNRSSFTDFTLFGDGATTLYIRNLKNESVTGVIDIAVLTM